MSVTPVTPLQILKEARQKLNCKESWTKGKYFTSIGDNKCFCVAGAIRAAVSDHFELTDTEGITQAAFRFVSEAIPFCGPRLSTGSRWVKDELYVIEYNDHPRRKFIDIKNLFRRAIMKARA